MNSCVPKVFGSITPPQLGLRVTHALRADAVAPVIFISEAAAGPAHVRYLHRLQRGDDVVADAARIRDLGVRADPDAFINAVAEMLGELAEDVAVDFRAGLGRIHRQDNLLCSQNGRSEQSQRSEQKLREIDTSNVLLSAKAR